MSDTQVCQYVFTSTSKNHKKGDQCIQDVEGEHKYCSTHIRYAKVMHENVEDMKRELNKIETSKPEPEKAETKVEAKPKKEKVEKKSDGKKCDAQKKDSDEACGRPVCGGSEHLCAIHQKMAQRLEETKDCGSCVYVINGKGGKKVCGKTAVRNGQHCRAHSKCEAKIEGGVCGKKVHAHSHNLCIIHDMAMKCRVVGCEESFCEESEQHLCTAHYRKIEKHDMCLWPNGCTSKPTPKSEEGYCTKHHKKASFPRCAFLSYNKLRGEFVQCKDHTECADDTFCTLHSKKSLVHSEKFDGDISRAYDIGRIVTLAKHDNDAVLVDKLKAADTHFAYHLYASFRGKQYRQAVRDGIVEMVEYKEKGPQFEIDESLPKVTKVVVEAKPSKPATQSQTQPPKIAVPSVEEVYQTQTQPMTQVNTQAATVDTREPVEVEDDEDESPLFQAASGILNGDWESIQITTNKREFSLSASDTKKKTLLMTEGKKKVIVPLAKIESIIRDDEEIVSWE
jgi:hypothetical protein